jgi:tRNA(fMet)-specific endonuclease VapC
MGTLIDSSVLIAWERNQLNLEDQLADSADEDFGVSAITASELLHGVHRASTPAQRRRREAFVEGLLSRIPIVAFDAVTAASMHACPLSSRLKAPPSVHTI